MASIYKRGAFWRAQIRRGAITLSETFDTQAEAKAWAWDVERQLERGSFIDPRIEKSTTLGELLQDYERLVVPHKRYPGQERQRINRWLETPLATRTLASLRGKDFSLYRDARRKAGRAENTIRLELQLVSRIFELARKEWGYEGLKNPLKDITKPSGSQARERILEPGEFEKLHARLSASENPWAAPAFELAILTTLRAGTLFALEWPWINLAKRLIEIPPHARGTANKGVPARLPLSLRAVSVFRYLAALHQPTRIHDPKRMQIGPVNVDPTQLHGPVFGCSRNAVIMVWKRVVKDKQSGFPDLRWHDLRHTGVTSLFLKGLHPMQVASISGHRSMQMLKRYTHLDPSSLLPLLD
ncbi:site-specific integrase [Paraburkholderia acidipaludis]|uniref:site-specific integrase n=1 Tax=Paraburkholderia acidipaludis TaxID=660537 RepID=UPI000488773A|nr:site-specific integrase [Paraburkholderia acidipaludis]